ncbi:MAG: hypothetical protein JXK07_12065 [Spirochaetes bacterium]|nr:hypothetical protein [Spirochaetota bacterium]MBN2769435.1 hypothetical protein [Spirochaetota bacterium]
MIISSVFFDTQLVLYLIAAGFALIIPFFVHIFRYPYLDSTWLYSIAEEIAANITNKGKHSLKPVIIDTVSNRKCIINTVGIILYYKNNKVIGIMNRKTHRALGSPNLHEFFTSLVETIRKTRTMR